MAVKPESITVDQSRPATQPSDPANSPLGQRAALLEAVRMTGNGEDEKTAFQRTRQWYGNRGNGDGGINF